jgi:hypothetical protein
MRTIAAKARLASLTDRRCDHDHLQRPRRTTKRDLIGMPLIAVDNALNGSSITISVTLVGFIQPANPWDSTWGCYPCKSVAPRRASPRGRQAIAER